jgi:cytochrome c-type biogenesis protein CcmH
MRKASLVLGLVLAAALALGAFMAAPPAALAVQPDEVLADPKLESRARALSKHLRCLVCQNQSIDDSDAGLARDLRVLVRERLKAGDSDEEVLAFLVARYGDFVLLKPPVKPTTWLLWFGPFAIFAVAGLGIWAASRRKTPATAPAAPLTAAEREKLDALLAQDERPPSGPPSDPPQRPAS